MAQIESTAALKNLDQLAAVPGVDLFVGPADLAACLGYPRQTLHPSSAKQPPASSKPPAPTTNASPPPAAPVDFNFWLDQDIDLLFCTNDIACLKRGASLALDEARALLPASGNKSGLSASNNGGQPAAIDTPTLNAR